MIFFEVRAYVEAMVADAVARTGNGSRILRVHIVLGEMSDIDAEAIRTHWSELSQHTPAEKAVVNIRRMQAEAQCMACFQKYHPEGGEIRCPHCGSYGAKILSGEEFYLESIEMEDE